MLKIEAALIAASLLLALVRPTLGSNWVSKAEVGLSRLARRGVLSVAVVGITALTLRLAVLPIEPIPEPIVHDEFGYLLAADTFAHGRLTNPTHPMWVHFETFSILQKPTYQTFAPPAQGLVLALGKVVFGHPFWGIWLSAALMCAAITWMLQAWLSPEWALLGGALAILRYGVFGYWADSYWGGAVAAIGGALVLGALPRIKESQRIRDALLMGVGLAILANSRPYEGFVFSLPVAFLLFVWMCGKNRPPLCATLRRIVTPLVIVLILSGTGMAYYCWRVTGNLMQMPYQIEQRTYAVAPYMLWQHIRPHPTYNNPVIEKMYVQEAVAGYQASRSFAGVLLKTYLGWSFFLGPALTLPLLMLVFSLPNGFSWSDMTRDSLALVLLLCISAAGWALESFYNPHYSAPATGLILALILTSMRHLRSWGRTGLFLARTIPAICVLSFAARVAAHPLHVHLAEYYQFAWHQDGPRSFGRSAVLCELQRLEGEHLVIVRYKPEHEPFAEWVYNDADIDHARVVWAREVDPSHDHQLINYFRNRRVWLLEADEVPPKLTILEEKTRGNDGAD